MEPKIHKLTDYTRSEFSIDEIFLHFDLHEERTTVTSILHIHRQATEKKSPLVLNGEEMKLLKIVLNKTLLAADAYQVDEHTLTIFDVPDQFTLETEVEIKPQENKRLSGLYKSGKIFCTQCESHGFRRITYFLDRPDILTRFTTNISADKTLYPVLLANGNLTDSHELPEDRAWVKWEDPTLKPCYLFALVAGDLDSVEDTFETMSGRQVKLAVYVEPGKSKQATYALSSLKAAMRWDEIAYGREYELDIYMIVAVNDFNFGAMENKGLNIFNDKYILADQEIATDEDFLNVLSVVGHEYFHNWSGNRVTVRDWFQITLKEGLTVLREHQFTADSTSSVVARIKEVNLLKDRQFPEDAGPMAHPIYPDSYIEINNFYTATVYEKGAEVIRMIRTLLGPERFRKAMDVYFTRNDGHAMTVDDFIQAMEDGGEIDLTQFRRWYKQSGTPVLTVTDEYFPDEQAYVLTVSQHCDPTPDQPTKELLHIPLSMGLLDREGDVINLQLKDHVSTPFHETKVLDITEKTQSFHFLNVSSKPVPSLLRDFSAPVKLNYAYSDEDLVFLMSHDTNLFNRWNAGQTLMIKILLSLVEDYQQGKNFNIPDYLYSALARVFEQNNDDAAFVAEMFLLPTENYLATEMRVVDVEGIHAARNWLKKEIAEKMEAQFRAYYKQSQSALYELDFASMGKRRLKNLVLSYLITLQDKDIYHLCAEQCRSNNMTDVMGGLNALNHSDIDERAGAFVAFYQRWQHEPLIVDKWFGLQAQSSLSNTFENVVALTKHAAFDIKNPNKVRALLGSFSHFNPIRFHDLSGEPYKLLVDYVLQIDKFNPQLASRTVAPLIHWKKFDQKRQVLMKGQLERIAQSGKLSNDLYEIVSKGLV